MPVYHVIALDSFKMHYLVDAPTPERAEEIALLSHDEGQEEWCQEYAGELVLNVTEVQLDDPDLLAFHHAQAGHRTIPIHTCVLSDETQLRLPFDNA